MKIVHTYAKNMSINPKDPEKITFADRWGLTLQSKLGHKVTLICGGYNKKRKEYFHKGIKIIELPILFELSSSTRIIKDLSKELKTINTDIFHSHHYCFLTPELTAIIGKIRKIPTFVTIHSSFKGREGIIGIFERIYSILMQPIMPFYSKVFFISNYIKSNSIFNLTSKKKKKITYNYFIKPKNIKVKREENEILYVGRLTHLKGIDILFKIFSIIKKQHPNIKLNVVGDGSKKYKKKLEKLSKILKIKENIVYHGELYGKEKWKQFYSNTVLIMPSRDEGFGNVAIEGMLCNIPTIVSNKGSLPEAVGKYGIIINIKDIPNSTKKIIELLKDKEKRKGIAKKAKKYAEKFTEERLGKILIEEYKKAIKNGKRI